MCSIVIGYLKKLLPLAYKNKDYIHTSDRNHNTKYTKIM